LKGKALDDFYATCEAADCPAYACHATPAPPPAPGTVSLRPEDAGDCTAAARERCTHGLETCRRISAPDDVCACERGYGLCLDHSYCLDTPAGWDHFYHQCTVDHGCPRDECHVPHGAKEMAAALGRN
jgi:hypothetical protein